MAATSDAAFDALDIARQLIRVGEDPEFPDESVPLTPLRLQKLLYYCQGWSLALLGRPLFHQPMEAWIEGPVVRDVFEQFRGTSRGITPEAAGELRKPLPPEVNALVEMVWRAYAPHTPRELSEMTHREPAWKEARGNLPPEARSTFRLSPLTMQKYFSDLRLEKAAAHTRSGCPVIDPIVGWDAMRAVGPDQEGVEATDLFESLLAECDE